MATISDVTTDCKTTLLSNLFIEIIEEDLIAESTTVFVGKFNNWLGTVRPRIRKIDTSGVETLLVETTDYTLDLPNGKVTLVVAVTTEIIRADYCFNPFSDSELDDLGVLAAKEISVLIHRPIDTANIPVDYEPSICKRLYTNVLKNLLVESRNFFSITVGDRTISKEQIPAQLEAMKKTNEEDLLLEINQLRNWNQTERFI